MQPLRPTHGRNARTRSGFVHHVNSFVRQKTPRKIEAQHVEIRFERPQLTRATKPTPTQALIRGEGFAGSLHY
jgi:hypothetical protein